MEGSPELKVQDYIYFGLVRGLGLGGLLALSFVFAFVLAKGLVGFELSFLTSQSENAGRSGGIFSVLVATLYILLLCLGLVVPLGIGAAVCLAQVLFRRPKLYSHLSLALDTLAGIPSIVFGLFGLVFFGEILGFGYSILSGGMTLSLMIFPYFIRTFEEGVRPMMEEYDQALDALGVERFRRFGSVYLPPLVPHLAQALILATGRALSETAALLFTSGYVDRLPKSPFDSGRYLSVHIYDLAMNVAGGEVNAVRSAAVLIVSMALLFFLTRTLSQSMRRTS